MSEMKRPDVVGIGQCSYDILGRLQSFPQADQKTDLDEILLQGGGPIATALVTLSRFGTSTAFCGAVGDDEFGRKIEAGLRDEQVDCSGLKVEPGAASQTAFIAVDKDGLRTVFCHPGTTTPLEPKDLDHVLIRRSKILLLDGTHVEVACEAARIARANSVVTVLDGGSVRPGSAELLPLIDHLVVSEKFVGQLSPGKSPQDVSAHLLEYGATTAVVTCGAKGVWAQQRGDSLFHQSAFPVPVVDTTGCGDVFHGGYVYGLLQGWPLADIVRFASVCAALKARQLGGRSGIPNIDEVNSCLKEIKE